jgi:TetR/AcrR family transcriptional repressor of nem operon
MILTHARVPKGSFYHYFPNKAAFGRAAIAAYRAYFVAKMERHLGDDSLAPLARVAAFAAAAEAGMARHGFRRGCLIGNLGQEMGALPEEFRADLIATLEDWQARLARVLQLAQNQGEISPHHNPADLAQMFWIGWEGAVLRAKLERGPAPLRLFAAQFLAQLNTTPKGDAPCSMPS